MSVLLAFLLGTVYWYGVVQDQIPPERVDLLLAFFFALLVIRTGMDNISDYLKQQTRDNKEILAALAVLYSKDKDNERK